MSTHPIRFDDGAVESGEAGMRLCDRGFIRVSWWPGVTCAGGGISIGPRSCSCDALLKIAVRGYGDSRDISMVLLHTGPAHHCPSCVSALSYGSFEPGLVANAMHCPALWGSWKPTSTVDWYRRVNNCMVKGARRRYHGRIPPSAARRTDLTYMEILAVVMRSGHARGFLKYQRYYPRRVVTWESMRGHDARAVRSGVV